MIGKHVKFKRSGRDILLEDMIGRTGVVVSGFDSMAGSWVVRMDDRSRGLAYAHTDELEEI
jgi:hypothetical protein